MPLSAFTKRVGNYYLGRTLGEGNYAKVKYGQHTETGEAVAIKILDKDRLEKDDMVDQIKREIAILKHLKHPNVVNLIEVMASDEKIYMVMELVSGGELFDKIVVEGPMNEAQARKVLHELIDALSVCHAAGIYHRDLKPENVLVTEDGTAKLSDFGLGALPNSVNTENGKLMTTCGTPNYVAPEVLAKGGYEGAPADIWSLGVVLYVTMAGCLPFDEPSLPALFRQITQAKYTCPPWFTKPLRSLVKKMICVDPAQRITLEELKKDPWVIEGGYQPQLCQMSSVTDEEANDIFAANTVYQIDMTQSERNLAALGKTLGQATKQSGRVNAFLLISAAIDLSGMFEQRKDIIKRHTRFTSRAEKAVILEAIIQVASEMQGTTDLKEDENKVKFVFQSPKGLIMGQAEVFEVIPGTRIVEVIRNQGDYLEFYNLYNKIVARGKAIVEEITSSKEATFEPMMSNKNKSNKSARRSNSIGNGIGSAKGTTPDGSRLFEAMSSGSLSMKNAPSPSSFSLKNFSLNPKK